MILSMPAWSAARARSSSGCQLAGSSARKLPRWRESQGVFGGATVGGAMAQTLLGRVAGGFGSRGPGRMVTVTTQTEQNKAFVLEYMKAFGTFDPDVYYPYLAENPTYMAGMNIRQGREAFKANTDAGKLL